jgi:hypothetical protein
MPTSQPPPDPIPHDLHTHLANLAEGLVEQIALRSPDWCQVAQDAQELGREAEARCQDQSSAGTPGR